MISIRTNTDSINAQQNLNINHNFQSKTIQQLTSGYRINSSADDAAGLAIANSYRSKITELSQGVSNANDGVSQLQIVDGGLGNISTILDRMKTLATQSASQTFTGNRSVLNQEYTGLLSEINRQATNVNLNAKGSFNTALSVYIGGSQTSANANINIDLSGAANAVDATSLGLSATSVAGGGAGISGNTLNLNTPNATFVKGSSTASDQTFTFNVVSPTGTTSQVQATVSATVNGSSLNDVLTSLNKQLSASGISAGVDQNGQLQFSGSTAFTVSDNSAQTPVGIGGTTPAISAKTTGTNLLTNEVPTGSSDKVTGTAENSSNYSYDGKATYVAPTSGVTESLTFTNASGNSFTAKLTSSTSGATSGDTLAHALNSINAQTATYGIYAVANAQGTGISFQSVNSFSLADSAQTVATPVAATALTNFTNNVGGLNAKGSTAATTTTNFTGNTVVLTDAALGGSPALNSTTKAGVAQTFSLNIKGQAAPLTVTLAGVAGGYTTQASLLAALQTAINTAVAAGSPALAAGTITAGVDASNHLKFTSASALFSVTDNGTDDTAHDSPTSGITSTLLSTPLTGANSGATTLQATYAVGAGATTINIGGTSIAIAAGTTRNNAITAINSALGASGTVFATASGASGITFQGLSKFDVEGSTLTVTSTPTNAYLDSSAGSTAAQTFSFNIAGQSSPVTLSLAAIAGGYTGATALTALTTAIAANATLTAAGITAGQDANGALKFSSTTTGFNVTDNHDALAGGGITTYSSAPSSYAGGNSAALTYDATSYVVPVAASTLVIGGATVNLAVGDSLATAITKINAALTAAGNTSVLASTDSAGTGIQYQGAGALVVGTATTSSSVFSATSGLTPFASTLAASANNAEVNATYAINAINSAIGALGLVQGSIGAGQNKLQYAINLAQSQISNFSAAESQIRDTDVAQQAANLTKSQVLTQTSIAAMAQANQEPQSVLKLLQ